MKAVDLTGRRFGRLVVVSRSPGGQVPWLCACDCGGTKVALSANLRNGRTKSCGCWSRGPGNPNWQGAGAIPLTYWSRVNKGASSRGYEVLVSLEDVAALYEAQRGRCALTDVPIGFGDSALAAASLDRIDNRLGYVPGNVQWVCADINQMKSDLAEDRFVELCEMVAARAQAQRQANARQGPDGAASCVA